MGWEGAEVGVNACDRERAYGKMAKRKRVIGFGYMMSSDSPW
jgi:hypothetical protein